MLLEGIVGLAAILVIIVLTVLTVLITKFVLEAMHLPVMSEQEGEIEMSKRNTVYEDDVA